MPYTSKELDEYSKVATNLVQEAGKLVLSQLHKTSTAAVKSNPRDLVTEVDQNVEKFIFSNLKEKFPQHCFIGEEACADGDHAVLTDQPTWIVDPIDGTLNFVHSFPLSCISIGLAIDKVPVVGAVFNPFHNHLFTAVVGRGAFLNGEPISSSKKEDLAEALVIVECGGISEFLEERLANNTLLCRKARGIRTLGSAVLNMCHVASGWADAYVEYGPHCWDLCAGYVIATESGAIVRQPDPTFDSAKLFDLMARSVLVAATPTLASSISTCIPHHPKLERDDVTHSNVTKQ